MTETGMDMLLAVPNTQPQVNKWTDEPTVLFRIGEYHSKNTYRRREIIQDL